MTLERAGLRQLDGLIWAIIAAVAAAVLVSLLLSDFRLAWASFSAPVATAAVFAAGQRFYRTRRPDPRLAAALGCTAQVVAFAAVGAPLSYLAASTNFPLYDHWFEAADKALGLDWFALFEWFKGHATASFLLRLVYLSLMPQTVVVILALSLAGQFAALRIFVLAFVLAALVTIALSAFWPAQGVWLQHELTASDGLRVPASATSWPVFLGLRDGTFRLLMARGAEGIITFPSLHAALALILAVALWPLPVLRWIGVSLNATMMVSIPIDGSHYFIDILAGLGIAVACLMAARAMVQRVNQPRQALAATPLEKLATTSR